MNLKSGGRRSLAAVSRFASTTLFYCVRMHVNQVISVANSQIWRDHSMNKAEYSGNHAVFGPRAISTAAIRNDRLTFAPCQGGAFQWCKPHPATAPAGSNRSSHGGDEMAEAFGVAGHESVKARVWRRSPQWELARIGLDTPRTQKVTLAVHLRFAG